MITFRSLCIGFTAAGLLLPASSQAAPTKSQKKQANALYAPVAKYAKNAGRNHPGLETTMNTWNKDLETCLTGVEGEVKDIAPAADASAGAPFVIFAVILFDGVQTLSSQTMPEMQAAQKAYANMKVSDPKLKKLAKIKAKDLTFQMSIPDIDACAWYKSWALTGFSESKAPDIWPGMSIDKLTKINETDSSAGEAGIKQLRKFGLSKKKAEAVESFPYNEAVS